MSATHDPTSRVRRLTTCSIANARRHRETSDALIRVENALQSAQQPDAWPKTLTDVLVRVLQDVGSGLSIMHALLFNAVVVLQRTADRTPNRLPTQAFAVFEDAHWRVCHIDTTFVQTWEVIYSLFPKASYPDRD